MGDQYQVVNETRATLSNEKITILPKLLNPIAVFFRRRVIEQFGLFDEKLNYCMDYEYWLGLASQGVTFYYFPRLLAGSRLYPAAKTLRDRLKVHYEINDMFYKKFGSVPDCWLYNYAHVFAEVRGLNRQTGFLFFGCYCRYGVISRFSLELFSFTEFIAHRKDLVKV